jgi:hypothetical protein
LARLLKDPGGRWVDAAYSTWSEDGSTLHGTAVRTAEWRYAEFGSNGENGAMLFDPHADPMELKNLAEDAKYAEKRKELSALVRGWNAG